MSTKKIVLSRDPDLLAIMRGSFFQREGFEMILVQDGQTGFQAVEKEAPTLAVFDLAQMGDQALKCCRAIKADSLLAATPVLLLLPDRVDENLADKCWDAGCDAVVHRPLVRGRFLDAACGLLGISRRLARRFPVSFQLALLEAEQKKHVGSCINLNAGGMFLATESLFPVNTQMRIEFALPKKQALLQCGVRIAWVNHPEWRKKNALPCGMGLQFISPDVELREFLKEFVATLTIDD